jgi:hypothetical protein
LTPSRKYRAAHAQTTNGSNNKDQFAARNPSFQATRLASKPIFDIQASNKQCAWHQSGYMQIVSSKKFPAVQFKVIFSRDCGYNVVEKSNGISAAIATIMRPKRPVPGVYPYRNRVCPSPWSKYLSGGELNRKIAERYHQSAFLLGRPRCRSVSKKKKL